MISWWIQWVFVLSYVFAQDPVANLPQGRIVGIKVYAKDALVPIEAYFGIPYATSPIGRHRFSAPERHPGWRRTFFAHRIPPRCPQSGDIENQYFSEDCLFLNIWTPRHADTISLPVVVILYSESWYSGGVSLPCQDLAAEGVVVVTVTYRLHLLSFFTLRSIEARGNLGLLDQYLALLWIRENISAFGGDPTAITLLGHSAGADSVLYHIASPRAIGLFQRAIIMSPREIWKVVDENMEINATVVEETSRSIAGALNCNGNTDHEILHCMRNRPLSDLTLLYSNANWSSKMKPIADDFLPQSEQYIPTLLSVALSSTKQPVMQLDLLLGATDLEVINHNDKQYEELLKQDSSYIAEYTNNAIPKLLKMFSLHNSQILPLLIQAVRWEFWNSKLRKTVNKEALVSLEALARAETSAIWNAGTALMAARLARRVTRLYVYRFSQPIGINIHGMEFNFTGAVHGSDLVALLGDAMMLQIARRPASPDEKRISLKFRKYVANFIKFGFPGDDEWQRYKAGDAQIHDIRDESITCDSLNSASKEVAFWLQYLPHLSNTYATYGHTEQLTSETGKIRLRGGVYGLCGISVVLLLLLLACVILLRRERRRRSSMITEG